MSRFVIIVAGGSGSRMKSTIPKQFLIIKKKPLLYYTLKAFFDFDNSIKIILVLPKNHLDTWKDLCNKYCIAIPHTIAEGGENRFDSVKSGLNQISGSGIVAIHDGVRPFVSVATIFNCFEGAKKEGNAIPVISLVDSIREIEENSSVSQNRDKYVLVQTPQTFKVELIKKAYQEPFSKLFTDDASVLESINIKINLVPGNQENIKITNPFDLLIAKTLLSN